MEGAKMKARSLPSSGQLLYSTVSLLARAETRAAAASGCTGSAARSKPKGRSAHPRACPQPSWRNVGSARSGSRKHLKNVNFFGQSYDSSKLLVSAEGFPRAARRGACSGRPGTDRGCWGVPCVRRFCRVAGAASQKFLHDLSCSEISTAALDLLSRTLRSHTLFQGLSAVSGARLTEQAKRTVGDRFARDAVALGGSRSSSSSSKPSSGRSSPPARPSCSRARWATAATWSRAAPPACARNRAAR